MLVILMAPGQRVVDAVKSAGCAIGAIAGTGALPLIDPVKGIGVPAVAKQRGGL
jgi:hypothetical protein